MKRLYVLRHAKSSWDDPSLDDHDRPLAKRGRKAAEAIARHLKQEKIRPELVLCSTSRRTRETFERIEGVVKGAEVRYSDEVYEASPRSILECLQRAPDEFSSVLLIGHNPGVQILTLDLAVEGPGIDAIKWKFPTAALATLDLAVSSWGDVDSGTATLRSFVLPRDLE